MTDFLSNFNLSSIVFVSCVNYKLNSVYIIIKKIEADIAVGIVFDCKCDSRGYDYHSRKCFYFIFKAIAKQIVAGTSKINI